MNLRNQKQIREYFDAKRATYSANYDDNGVANALRTVAEIMQGLKDAGLDIDLRMNAPATDLAYSMMAVKSVPPFSGIVHIGNAQLLLGVFTSIGGENRLVIALSTVDVKHLGLFSTLSDSHIRTDLPCVTFDVAKSTRALPALQETLINYAARQSLAEEYSGQTPAGVLQKDIPVMTLGKVKNDRTP